MLKNTQNIMLNVGDETKPIFNKNIKKDETLFSHGTRLVLGTSGLGGVWGNADFSESIDAVSIALEEGILSFDTAPSYNRAEEFLGKALRNWHGKKPFISTKVGRLFAEEADHYNLDYSKDGMTKSLENSLKVIGVDCFDLLFLHEPHLVTLDQKDEILTTLQSFKDQGLVKMLGVGGNPTPSFQPYLDSNLFEVVSGFTKMDACNLTAFKQDIPSFKSKGMAYYAASALHMGLLGSRLQKHAQERPNNEWISNTDVDNALEIEKIAKRENIEISELAMRYLFSIKEADRVVLGARSINQVKSLVKCWNKGSISESIFNEITSIIIKTS